MSWWIRRLSPVIQGQLSAMLEISHLQTNLTNKQINKQTKHNCSFSALTVIESEMQILWGHNTCHEGGTEPGQSANIVALYGTCIVVKTGESYITNKVYTGPSMVPYNCNANTQNLKEFEASLVNRKK